MDSVPATVPSVTVSPGDSELLGPLSVLYAAFIAKLLEVRVRMPREGPRLRQAGRRVVSGVGALTGGGRAGVGQGRGGQDVAVLFREPGGSDFKVSSLVNLLLIS